MSNPYDPSGGSGGGQQDLPPGQGQGADPNGPGSQDPQSYAQQPPYGQQPPYEQGQQTPYGQPAPQQPNPYGQPAPQQPSSYGQQQNPYGANPYATNPHAATPAVKTNGLAIASLITSLGGLLGFFCGFLGLAAPVGLVLGIIARKQIKEHPMTQGGEGVALGGIFAGVIITLMMAVFLLLYVAFYGWALLGAWNY